MASAIPPLAVPSSFVRTMPSTGTASEKSWAWRRPFCPVVASTVSSVSCGAPVELLADHAPDLGQLRHELVLRVQAPGGVDDHDVGAAARGPRDGLEGDRARVRAGLGRVTKLARRRAGPTPRAARPRPRGRCRPRRARTLRPSSCAQVPGELADRRRLARAVDPGDHDHRRLVAQVDARRRPRPRDVGQQLDEARGERLAALDLAARRPPARAARRPSRSSSRRRRP